MDSNGFSSAQLRLRISHGLNLPRWVQVGSLSIVWDVASSDLYDPLDFWYLHFGIGQWKPQRLTQQHAIFKAMLGETQLK